MRTLAPWIRTAFALGVLAVPAPAGTTGCPAPAVLGPPVAVTFTRLSAWSGGYGGQLAVRNLSAQTFTNWNLAFQTTDGVNPYNGAVARSGTTDTFNPGSNLRLGYFARNQAGDNGLLNQDGVLTWAPHLASAGVAGVVNVMFGDGVGASTRARPDGGTAPTDGWWLMTALQRYLRAPAPLP